MQSLFACLFEKGSNRLYAVYLFYDCSSEGVNVVLQMLDLLCKLKNDVIGLKVHVFTVMQSHFSQGLYANQ